MGGGGGGGSSWGRPHRGEEDQDLDTKIKEASAKLTKQAERIEELPDDKTTIFISHQNRDKEKTQRAHQYADFLKDQTEFDVNIDKEFFPKEQVTNLSIINKIISEAMRESDIFLALYHPVKDSNRFERSLWYDLEAKKARFWGKPIIHVFLDGSRDSGVLKGTKCYKIHYKKGEHWKTDLVEKIREIANIHKVKD
ncbi:MAG: hypothetical protein ACFFDF_17845 [Candidatus Odinarchaeota archaeon]